MGKVNCLACENWTDSFDCKHDFRWASDAGGRAVDCKEDVWNCQDYSEKENGNDECV